MTRYFAIGGTIHKKAFLSNSRVKWGCLGESQGNSVTYEWLYNGNYLLDVSRGHNVDVRMSCFDVIPNDENLDPIWIELSAWGDIDLDGSHPAGVTSILDSWDMGYIESCVFFTLDNGAFCLAFLDANNGYTYETGYNIFYEEYSQPVRIRIYMCTVEDGGVEIFYDEINGLYETNEEFEELVAASSSFALILDATYNSSTGLWSVTENG